MIPLVVTTAVLIAGWAMIKAGGWAAANPVIIAALLFMLGVIWLHFWHRRRMAEINELEYKKLGRFKPVSAFGAWPKYCQWCGSSVHSLKALGIHNDPGSACSRVAMAADRAQLAAELAEQEPDPEPADETTWTATVYDPPAGAVDTLTEDDTAAIGGRREGE